MPPKNNATERDAVLAAFLEQCPNPRPEQIAQWRELYPNYAADIVGLAADLLELSIVRGGDNLQGPCEDDLIPARIEFQEMLRQCESRQRRVSAGSATCSDDVAPNAS